MNKSENFFPDLVNNFWVFVNFVSIAEEKLGCIIELFLPFFY